MITILEEETEKFYVTVDDNTQLRVQRIQSKYDQRFSVFIASGFNSYIYAWEELIKNLATFDVYFLETREMESSILGSKNFSFERFAEDIYQLYRKMQLKDKNTIVLAPLLVHHF